MTQPTSHKGYNFGSLSYRVIGACQDVQRQMGVHCMELDYERALEIALSKQGLSWQREVEIPIAYDGIVVTRHRVDFLIWDDNEQLIIETKAASQISPKMWNSACSTCIREGINYVCWSTLARNR